MTRLIATISSRVSPATSAALVLALLFGVWAMRGISQQDLASDAPNHLMNGALIADWLRSGDLLHPIGFAKEHYSRLPASTIPYHPPMFPAIEGVFFSLFGVSTAVGRLAIAVTVVANVLLLCRLLSATGFWIAAVCATATFFSLEPVRTLLPTVMLEFPALLFALGALWQLMYLESGFPLRRALAFGILAGAAVWTKQQVVFLGAVPFFLVAVSRQWSLLKTKSLWIATALFAVSVATLLKLSAASQGAGGVREVPPVGELTWRFVRVLRFYWIGLLDTLGMWPLLWMVACLLWFFWRQFHDREPNRGIALCLAWVPASLLILVVMGHFSHRYLVFTYPPALFLGFEGMRRLASLLSPRFAWVAPGVVATIWLGAGLRTEPMFVTGPAEAADLVMKDAPHRILYCGPSTANFIFAVRVRDPELKTTVVRGDQIRAQFEPEEMEQIAHRYGIDAIVIGKAATPKPWDQLVTTPSPSMVLMGTVPLNSGTRSGRGSILIYRFTNASTNPDKALRIHVDKLGQQLDVPF